MHCRWRDRLFRQMLGLQLLGLIGADPPTKVLVSEDIPSCGTVRGTTGRRKRVGDPHARFTLGLGFYAHVLGVATVTVAGGSIRTTRAREMPMRYGKGARELSAWRERARKQYSAGCLGTYGMSCPAAVAAAARQLRRLDQAARRHLRLGIHLTPTCTHHRNSGRNRRSRRGDASWQRNRHILTYMYTDVRAKSAIHL